QKQGWEPMPLASKQEEEQGPDHFESDTAGIRAAAEALQKQRADNQIDDGVTPEDLSWRNVADGEPMADKQSVKFDDAVDALAKQRENKAAVHQWEDDQRLLDAIDTAKGEVEQTAQPEPPAAPEPTAQATEPTQRPDGLTAEEAKFLESKPVRDAIEQQLNA